MGGAGGGISADALAVHLTWIVLWRLVVSLLALGNLTLLAVLVRTVSRWRREDTSREQRIAEAIAGIREDRRRDKAHRAREREQQQQREREQRESPESEPAGPAQAQSAASRRRWLP